MTLLARLKPLNERKGYNVRVYMFEGARFMVERGWYEVPDDMGERMRDLHQDHYDLDSPDLFDVCTPEEAKKLEARERVALENARATASRPSSIMQTRTVAEKRLGAERVNNSVSPSGGDMTSADLRGGQQQMVDPDPDGDELETDEADGRVTEVGRIAQTPRTRMKRSK